MYTKFDDPGSHNRSQEMLQKNLNGEKAKLTNKGNDKQEEADSNFTRYN